MAAIVEAILAVPAKSLPRPMAPKLEIADYLLDPLQELTALLATQRNRLLLDPQVEALRLVTEKNYIDYLVPYLEIEEIEAIGETAARARQQYVLQRMSYMSLESTGRYNFIDKYLAEACADDTISKVTFSERIDSVISHTVGGPLILMLILAFIFNTIFSWAEYPMGWIEAGIGWLSLQATTLLPQGIIQSLIVDGIIAGVGNVIVFLPQIVLLIFFISLLEDSGYITRMAFILDRIMKKWGLHGKAVLPMLSGFACAIPAIMASRTIENWRDRLITILLIPLMSCSARLPVYILLISAFIPQQTIFGFIQLQALVLMTVLTIVAGLLPIFFTDGLGTDVMRRIALPMVGGMVSTTVLTLIVIPVVYMLWEGRHFRGKTWRAQNAPSAKEAKSSPAPAN